MFASYITHRLITLSSLILLLFGSTPNAFAKDSGAEPVNILVSIKPLHSLISHITDGLNQNKLLLTQQQSPHNFQLLPSQKRLINNAKLFFYSSDSIESFVPGLKNTTKDVEFIQLSNIPGIHSLPVRSFHSHQHNESSNIDGHIWLSIENAKIIASYVTNILSKRSPDYSELYNKNLKSLLLKLNTLKQENFNLLNKHKDKPYLVYHDAYQYFEVENNLSGAHFITSDPEHAPGIRRVIELRKLIDTENIQCIFYEPPNIPALLYTLTEKKSVKLSAIDPAGLIIPMGKQHYFQLLRQTATSLDNCLKL